MRRNRESIQMEGEKEKQKIMRKGKGPIRERGTVEEQSPPDLGGSGRSGIQRSAPALRRPSSESAAREFRPSRRTPHSSHRSRRLLRQMPTVPCAASQRLTSHRSVAWNGTFCSTDRTPFALSGAAKKGSGPFDLPTLPANIRPAAHPLPLRRAPSCPIPRQ
jgi:hypothetical protein